MNSLEEDVEFWETQNLIIEENFDLLERILNMYQYIGEPQPSITKQHPSHFFQIHHSGLDLIELEVNSDASEGAIHRTYSTTKPQIENLTAMQLNQRLAILHTEVEGKAIKKAKKEAVLELAMKRLEAAGIY